MKLEELNCICENIDLDKYIEHVLSIRKTMTNPEWLGLFTKEDIINMLNNNSKIWEYYLDKNFVCSMMLIPSTQKDLDKFDINLNYQDVVDYGPMFVDKKYVGNKLQFQMLKALDEYSKQLGYKYAASTIHPDNIYSVNNLLKDDFELKGSKVLKRGERNIYLKKY